MYHVLKSIQVTQESYFNPSTGQSQLIPNTRYLTECGNLWLAYMSNDYVSPTTEKWPDETTHREATCKACYAAWSRYQVMFDGLKEKSR